MSTRIADRAPRDSATAQPPPVDELFSIKRLAERHPNLLPESRIRWAVRNRASNGLAEVGAVFLSPVHEFFLHEPAMIRWVLGLAGRNKPRLTRKAA